MRSNDLEQLISRSIREPQTRYDCWLIIACCLIVAAMAVTVTCEPRGIAPEENSGQGIATPWIQHPVGSLPVDPEPLIAKLIPLPQSAEHRRVNAIEAEEWYIRLGVGNESARLAMLANAWHESRFNPRAEAKEKNGSMSRGFHQLNTRGAGRGMPRELQLTIRHNVAAIMRDGAFANWYREHKAKGWSAGKSAYEFARRVERCASRYWNARRVTAEKWSHAIQGGLGEHRNSTQNKDR